MKIIAIVKQSGYSHSYVENAIVEMSGSELNALIGKKRNGADLKVGDKIDLTKQIDNFHQLRCQFNDIARTANHLRTVADKMDEFPLPEWSKE